MEAVVASTSWHSYPSVFALGHRALANLFDGPVVVHEKVDGSQISWGIFDGELRVRSKGADINLFAPEPLFAKAVETIRELEAGVALREGWTYRGEYLQKPKHHTLAYDRVPKGHIILFDINTGYEEYMLPVDLEAEADYLGLEVVPLLDFDVFPAEPAAAAKYVRSFLDRESILGGQKIEGVVIKNYSQTGPQGKVLMGKFVSEAFKEIAKPTWKEDNPGRHDIVQRLISTYATPARWNKAILHLRERGELEDSPRDIGKLIAEVLADVEKECREEIADAFYSWGWPHVRRALTSGFPEFYTDPLLSRQFEEEVA